MEIQNNHTFHLARKLIIEVVFLLSTGQESFNRNPVVILKLALIYYLH